uniref:Uncharacterized protein n=1 Tax=Arundo donax TaxID=35708 RepID=A0A0A9FZN6_ARUDO
MDGYLNIDGRSTQHPPLRIRSLPSSSFVFFVAKIYRKYRGGGN